MSKMQDSENCGPCWDGRHKCIRNGISRCRDCTSYLQTRQIHDQSSIRYAAPFYTREVYEQLFKNPPLGSSCSLDTHEQRPSTFNLTISHSNGPDINFKQEIHGPYTVQNRTIIDPIDALVKQSFSAHLAAKEGPSKLISSAALAGGYACLLCSVTQVTEQVTTLQDGYEIQNEYRGYNLEAQFKYLLVCRLRELIGEVLDAIRFEDLANDHRYLCLNAYAAAVVLRYELDHFKSNMRNGSLRNHVASGLRYILLGWFDSVERELMDRIREGCGRFPLWRGSVIEGSMKSLRRRDESLIIAMRLELTRSSTSCISQNSFQASFGQYPYTNIGNGHAMLPMMESTKEQEYIRDGFQVSLTTTGAPKAPQKSSDFGANYAGHLSYQLSEQEPCASYSELCDHLTCLDPSCLIWYSDQSPL